LAKERIESCVYGLFTRLQAVEAENLHLRAELGHFENAEDKQVVALKTHQQSQDHAKVAIVDEVDQMVDDRL